MEQQDRERLVRVEEGIKTLTNLFKEHKQLTCAQHGCSLSEDVTSLKITQKWSRWAGKTFVGAMLVSLVAYLTPKIANVLGGIDGF